MSDCDYGEIEALTLKMVPELREVYYEFGWDPIPYPTDEWLDILQKSPLEDERRLGATILFESILAPFLLSLLQDVEVHRHRISQLMSWIETLAHHDDTRVRETLVGVCICEKILDTESSELVRRAFRAFGSETKELCRSHAKRLRLSTEIRQLIGLDE